MAPSATATQSHPSKMKRPIPPGIQTNGINSSASSPSPSMSASRLPSASKLPPNSATSNSLTNNGNGIRSANRVRREIPGQQFGRGQRNSSVGLRSGSIVGESVAPAAPEPQPYVKTDDYILKKYHGKQPSLIIHMHQAHFRFDQQEGSFLYKSPMRIMLEHLKLRTIPHDLVDFFNEQNVPFYEGCMIVQVYDHRPSLQAPTTNKKGTGKAIPFSVHNYNNYLTPSPYVPYPTPKALLGRGNDNEDVKPKLEQKDKENMPAPPLHGQHKAARPPKHPRIMTVVLHPTPSSHHEDFANKALEPRNIDGRRDSRQDPNMGPLSATVPPTPTTGVPPTPSTSMPPPAKRVKKSKIEHDHSAILDAESKITLLTTAPLFLEPASSAGESVAILESLSHPMHCEKPPAPKTRKRTVAEMAADEALAADQERYMLILDERLSSNVDEGANPADNDGQAGGASFEPRFERFKVLENIKAQHEENKKIDKQRREEAERKVRQDQERNKLRDEAEKRDQEKTRVAMVMAQRQQQQQQQQQEAHRRQMAAQAQQTQQAMQGPATPIQAQHGHPQGNGINSNGMPSQPQRFHQQVSQAQASSPIVRNGTPQSHSSPLVNNMNNVPMQHSTSSMGGSPARPGSVVQQNHPQMGASAGHVMTAQRSQQSHAGTPRLPNSTPQVQSTPLNRQMSQTPRMSQGSPLQGQIAHTPQMMMVNGQPMQVTPQMAQMHQQRMQQQMMLQQQQQRMAQGMGVPGQQMNPQFANANAQMLRMAQAQQQQAAQGMAAQQNYQARMAALQAGGLNQNFIGSSPGVPMGQNMAQIQQIQQIQQARAAQAAVQAQFQVQAQQMQNMQNMQNPQAMSQQQFAQAQAQARVAARANELYLQQRQAHPNITPEMDQQLKMSCKHRATQEVRQQMMEQQKRQVMAMQQSGMQQANMQINMNQMQNGMGM